jgi:hypothetical protein
MQNVTSLVIPPSFYANTRDVHTDKENSVVIHRENFVLKIGFYIIYGTKQNIVTNIQQYCL